MIDFACKHFSLEEVIRCGLGLSKAEFKIMSNFLSNKKVYFSTQEIAKKLELDLSTVQRAVKKLYLKKVIERRQINIEGGGYLFRYIIKSKAEIKNIMLEIVQNWSKRVETEFDSWA
jgi:predicted transcriptional regulator